MHADIISAFGNEYVQTPNLDGLVDDGYAFVESIHCLLNDEGLPQLITTAFSSGLLQT